MDQTHGVHCSRTFALPVVESLAHRFQGGSSGTPGAVALPVESASQFRACFLVPPCFLCAVLWTNSGGSSTNWRTTTAKGMRQGACHHKSSAKQPHCPSTKRIPHPLFLKDSSDGEAMNPSRRNAPALLEGTAGRCPCGRRRSERIGAPG